MTDVILMDRVSFDELPAPPDDMIGKVAYVLSDTDTPGFRAVARVNADGDNEWYEERDTFQTSIVPSLTALLAIGAAQEEVRNADGNILAAGVDLSEYTEVRVSLNISVSAGVTSELQLRYWDALGSAEILHSHLFPLDADGVYETDWEPIPASARIPTSVFATTINGNGTEDVTLLAVVAHFRR